MYMQKLKKLNVNEFFTDIELHKINMLLISVQKKLSYDKAYEIDDVISDVFCSCLEHTNPSFVYTTSSRFPYHQKIIKSFTNKLYQKKNTQIRNRVLDRTTSIDECAGDVQRIKSHLLKTNQPKLLNLFVAIVDHVLNDSSFKTQNDRINVASLCRKLNLSREMYYRHFRQLRRLYAKKY